MSNTATMSRTTQEVQSNDNYDLTAYSARGGCSCKLSPEGLAAVCDTDGLRSVRLADHADDDAAIVDIGDGLALVSSVDFQTPMVADPHLSGLIAANNALSDIFACGHAPSWAEVTLAVPDVPQAVQVEIGRAMMEGLARACGSVGCKIVGGHSLVLPTPIIGLAVRAIGPLANTKRKGGARPGDCLMITKPLGTGLLVSARQTGFATPAMWAEAEKVLLQCNSAGADLGSLPQVSSMTDITGFSLLGHACEVAKASNVSIEIDFARLPLLKGALRAAAEGLSPALAMENWAFVENQIRLDAEFTTAEIMLMSDPQTNGGLMFSVPEEHVAAAQHVCAVNNQPATIIGKVTQASNQFVIIKKGNDHA